MPGPSTRMARGSHFSQSAWRATTADLESARSHLLPSILALAADTWALLHSPVSATVPGRLSYGRAEAQRASPSPTWWRGTYRPLRAAGAGPLATPGLIWFSFEVRPVVAWFLSAAAFASAAGRAAWRTFNTFCQLARISSGVTIGGSVILQLCAYVAWFQTDLFLQLARAVELTAGFSTK